VKEFMLRIPRGFSELGVYLKGVRVTLLRRLILVREVIDHLFDFNRVFWWEVSILDKSSKISVARGVDIDRESRERARLWIFIVTLIDLLILIFARSLSVLWSRPDRYRGL
jgi:hypothetical protein